MSLTAPVSKDQFHYANGDLYVETGGSNRHRRATVAELKDLFHPNKKSKVPEKDRPAHWYEAQLVHYGLPASKVKGTAVKRLLDAFNKGDLAVPKGILELEKNLKKQWTANEKKAKREAKDSPSAGKPASGGLPKVTKRKTAELSFSNPESASVNVNGVQFNLNFNLSGTQCGEPCGASNSGTKKTKIEKAKKQPVNEKGGLTSSSRQASAKVERRSTSGTVQTKQKVNTASNQQRGLKADTKVKRETQAKTQNKVTTGRVIEGQHSIEKGAIIKSAGKKKEADVKHEYPSSISPFQPTIPRFASPGPSSVGLINGVYEVSCPFVEEQWMCEDLTISLRLDTPNVWGAYDFGIFSGIFLLQQRPYKASDVRLPVRWRGRENGEGEITCGNNNKGWISFPGDGRIEGCLQIEGDCKFVGRRIDGMDAPSSRDATSMRHEWESYSEADYEYERINRWH